MLWWTGDGTAHSENRAGSMANNPFNSAAQGSWFSSVSSASSDYNQLAPQRLCGIGNLGVRTANAHQGINPVLFPSDSAHKLFQSLASHFHQVLIQRLATTLNGHIIIHMRRRLHHVKKSQSGLEASRKSQGVLESRSGAP